MNWCGDATGKKPHPQNVTVGLEGRLPDYWSSDWRGTNAID